MTTVPSIRQSRAKRYARLKLANLIAAVLLVPALFVYPVFNVLQLQRGYGQPISPAAITLSLFAVSMILLKVILGILVRLARRRLVSPKRREEVRAWIASKYEMALDEDQIKALADVGGATGKSYTSEEIELWQEDANKRKYMRKALLVKGHDDELLLVDPATMIEYENGESRRLEHFMDTFMTRVLANGERIFVLTNAAEGVNFGVERDGTPVALFWSGFTEAKIYNTDANLVVQEMTLGTWRDFVLPDLDESGYLGGFDFGYDEQVLPIDHVRSIL